MKKMIIAAIATMTFGMANAQQQVLTGTKFTDNWSIGIQGGATTPMYGNSFLNDTRAQIGLQISKEFTPYFGLTAETMWGINTSQRNNIGRMRCKTVFDNGYVAMLGRTNLSNIIGGVKKRLFEVEAFAGIGANFNLRGWQDQYPGDNEATMSPLFKTGVNLNFNVGEAKAWTIYLQPAVVWANTVNYSEQASSPIYLNRYNSTFDLNLGVAYHFKSSNGKHYQTRAAMYTEGEMNAATSALAAMEALKNQKETELAAFKKALDAANAELKKVKAALAECEARPVPTPVTNTVKNLESVVTFRQGKSSIDASQLPNVERIATYLKNNAGSKVEILGYASPEGSKEVNERIANQRAEAVKTMLINKYKIAADRISAKGCGVGDVFEEADWNRVAISTLVK